MNSTNNWQVRILTTFNSWSLIVLVALLFGVLAATAQGPLSDFNVEFVERGVVGTKQFRDVASKENFAFVLADGQLQVMGLTDRMKPRTVATVDLAGVNGRVILADDHAYVWGGTELGFEISIIDISNPGDPRKMSEFPIEGIAAEPAIRGNYIYVPGGSTGLQVIDIANPAVPRLAGTLDMAAYGAIACIGNYLYLPSSAELKILDLTDAANPRLAGIYRSDFEVGEAFLSGNYLWLTVSRPGEFPAGMEILDVSDPLVPRRVGFFDGGGSVGNAGGWLGVHRIATADSLAFVVERWWFSEELGGQRSKLAALDMTDPSKPQRIGTYQRAATFGDWLNEDEWVEGGMAATPDGLVYLASGPSLKVLEAVRVPILRVRQVGGALELFWSSQAGHFNPQQCVDMNGDVVWSDLAAAPTLEGREFSVRVEEAKGNRFFRLISL